MDLSVILEKLADWGSAGIVVIVVFVFLRHLKERDAELNDVLRDMTKAFHEVTLLLRAQRDDRRHRDDE